MPVHKTAMGRSVNMDTLRTQNENVRAVGNMNVNARGDAIDTYGRVIKNRNQQVDDNYNKTIATPGAQTPGANRGAQLQPDLSEVERELMNDNFTKK